MLRSIVLLMLVVPLGACSARHTDSKDTAATLPEDCDAFVAAYEACIASSSPASASIAHDRREQTHAALVEEARHASGDALASKCRDNLRRLTATCGGSVVAK